MPTTTIERPEHFGPLALVAGAIPVNPPREWFDNPELSGPTPLTVTADGRVFGHIAAWGTPHIGRPDVLSAPRSSSGYRYFHTGELECDGGSLVAVGQLTLAGGHAPMAADARAAAQHYDETRSAVADIRVGEDSYGIWASGALRPGTDGASVRALRASAPSGDWRPIGGSLELVGICQVNVPGFPIARALAASAEDTEYEEGTVLALVAAGASDIAMLRYTDPAVAERLAALEGQVATLTAAAEADALSARKAELRARVRGTV